VRLHVDEASSYDPIKRRLCFTAKIYLDGKLMTKVVEADEENGFIVRYKDQQRGFGQMPEYERLTGKVEIKDGGDNATD
jgi:hypothetical protein